MQLWRQNLMDKSAEQSMEEISKLKLDILADHFYNHLKWKIIIMYPFWKNENKKENLVITDKIYPKNQYYKIIKMKIKYS